MIDLELAETRLQDGDFRGATATLSGRAPSAFQAQRDFLEAEALRGQGYFRAAERAYRRVWTARTRAEDPALWMESGLALAACRRSLGAIREARGYLGPVSRLAKQRAWRSFAPQVELEAALIDRAAGRYGASLRVLRRLLGQSLRAKRWDEAGYVLWAMGGALRFAGRLADSRREFERSLAFAKRARDSQGEAYALFGLGGITRILGRLEESARYYALAGKRLAPTQDIFGKAYAECGFANALRQLGRWSEAQRHYLRSHKLYSSLEDEVDLAYVEWGLGKVHLGRGELKPAIARVRRSLDMFHRHGEARGEVLAGVALAQALHAAGGTAEAERLFAKAYALAKRSGLHAHIESYT